MHQTEYSSNSHGTFCLESPMIHCLRAISSEVDSSHTRARRTYNICEYVPPGMAVNEVILAGFEFRDLMIISCARSRSSLSDE
jgi:hypothetical protein